MNTRGFWNNPFCVKLFIPRLMVPIHIRKHGKTDRIRMLNLFRPMQGKIQFVKILPRAFLLILRFGTDQNEFLRN